MEPIPPPRIEDNAGGAVFSKLKLIARQNRWRFKNPTIWIVISLTLVVFAGAIFLVASTVRFLLSDEGQMAIAISLFPTETPIPTTPPPLNPQLHPGKILYEYQFKSQEDWDMGKVDDEWLTIERSITSDDKYRWVAQAKKGFHSGVKPETRMYLPGDIYQVSVDFRVIDGPEDAGSGMVFGCGWEGNLWTWMVHEDGSGILVRLVNGDWADPVIEQSSLPIHKGETNTLTIQMSGDTVYLYVNGRLVGSYTLPATDSHTFIIISGGMGIAMELANTGDKATVEFDNFVVSVPEKFGP